MPRQALIDVSAMRGKEVVAAVVAGQGWVLPTTNTTCLPEEDHIPVCAVIWIWLEAGKLVVPTAVRA